MPLPDTQHFLFVINPKSGGTGKDSWKAAIDHHFKTSPHERRFFDTTGEDDLEQLKKAVKDQRPDRIVAVGGDGTLKLVAEAAMDSQTPVGMLPAGSANGMASELGLPTDPAKALEVLTTGHIRAIDAICINDHFSLHLSDVGLNAKLIELFEEGEGRGQLGYAREVLRALRHNRSLRLHLELDGRVIRRTAAMVVIANGRMYGSGVVFNENSALDDGKFEVIVLREVSLFRLLCCMLLRRAKPGPMQEVFTVRTFKLRSRTDAPFQVDGEFLGKTRTLEAAVLPGAVRMLVPLPEA